jgi:hypothetical protein
VIHNNINIVGPSCDTRPPLSPRRVAERTIRERTGAGFTYGASRWLSRVITGTVLGRRESDVRISLKAINSELERRGSQAVLAKGDGYFYF